MRAHFLSALTLAITLFSVASQLRAAESGPSRKLPPQIDRYQLDISLDTGQASASRSPSGTSSSVQAWEELSPSIFGTSRPTECSTSKSTFPDSSLTSSGIGKLGSQCSLFGQLEGGVSWRGASWLRALEGS